MIYQHLVLLGLLALGRTTVVPVAVRTAPHHHISARIDNFDPHPQYSFAYDVQDALTGDSKAQFETRNGDLVQGRYSLIEPDGSRRIVDYASDAISGFNAVVRREPLILGAHPVAKPTIAVSAPVAVAGLHQTQIEPAAVLRVAARPVHRTVVAVDEPLHIDLLEPAPVRHRVEVPLAEVHHAEPEILALRSNTRVSEHNQQTQIQQGRSSQHRFRGNQQNYYQDQQSNYHHQQQQFGDQDYEQFHQTRRGNQDNYSHFQQSRHHNQDNSQQFSSRQQHHEPQVQQHRQNYQQHQQQQYQQQQHQQQQYQPIQQHRQSSQQYFPPNQQSYQQQTRQNDQSHQYLPPSQPQTSHQSSQGPGYEYGPPPSHQQFREEPQFHGSQQQQHRSQPQHQYHQRVQSFRSEPELPRLHPIEPQPQHHHRVHATTRILPAVVEPRIVQPHLHTRVLSAAPALRSHLHVEPAASLVYAPAVREYSYRTSVL